MIADGTVAAAPAAWVRDARAQAEDAARVVGLDPQGARVVRVGTSVLVYLPAGVVARVEPTHRAGSVARQVAFADAAAAVEAPVVRRVAPTVETGRALVTWWEALQPVAPPSGRALGEAAKALHAAGRCLPAGVRALLPMVDPLAAALAELDAPHPALTPADQAALRGLVQSWQARWAEEPYELTLVHGDLHRGNVVVTAHGPVLVDLEYAGLGPAAYDAAAVGAHVRRYGLDPEWIQGFGDAYGRAFHLEPTHAFRCDVYALQVALWALSVAHTGAEVAAEAALRVASLLGRTDACWTLR